MKVKQRRHTAKEDQPERAEDDEVSLTVKDNEADICQQLMDRYAKSSAEQHRHLLATAAAMRSMLTAESLPTNPPAYFAAAISAADSAVNSPDMDSTAVSALLTFLSIVIPLVPHGGIASEKGCEAVVVTAGLVEMKGEKLGAAGMRCGVKCLGSMLVRFADLDDWKTVQFGFERILKFSIDKRPKVRRCAQECLEEIFRSFQSPAVIKEASKLIYSLLEKYRPVAIDLSTIQIHEGSKGDLTMKPESMEALHLLNLLRVIIPFISEEVSYKVLLLLQKIMTPEYSAVTRQIFTAIEVFFSTSRDEIVNREMEDMITSLTEYLSLKNKNPVDTVMLAAMLLKTALEKLQLVDPKASLRKLPIVCDSLAGLLTYADDNASQATAILKELIDNHLDTKFLVRSGGQSFGDNIKESKEKDAVRSLCAIFESSLDLCDAIPSNHILAVISLLFQKLGELTDLFMRDVVLKLADLMTSTNEDVSNTDQLQSCIGSAVVAMGAEGMLKLVPIAFNADDLTYSNTWLIPVMRKYVVGSSLVYYMEHIVPLAKSFKQASSQVKKPELSKELQAHAHGLLGLLPAFCRYPTDIRDNFGSLAKVLVPFLKKNPSMRETIAVSLQVLVNQNKSMLRTEDVDDAKSYTGEDSTLELGSSFRYSKKMATKNIKTLALGSNELLQTLVDIFMASHPGTCPFLKDAIECLASITDSSIVKKIFTSLLKNLESSNDEEKPGDKDSENSESIDEEKMTPSNHKRDWQRQVLMDLAPALVEGAKEDLVELIYNFTRQAFQVVEGTGHHEAYHTLNKILEKHNEFCSSHFVEIIDMLVQLKSPDDSRSLKNRFACLHTLMVHAFKVGSEEENEKAFLMLNEIILKLKDENEESRKAAYDVVGTIYTSLKSSSTDETSNSSCQKLISMIMGYLSGSSPQIKSGAVSALSVLVYKDADICLTTPDFVSSLLPLLHTKTIEVIKAVLGFVKVVVSSLESRDLQSMLPDIVTKVLPWSSVSRHHFRSKVTIILEILIRKCGSWAVQSLAEERHKSFLKTVLENRSVRSSSKEKSLDQETPHEVSTKEPQKRKRDAPDSVHGENVSMELKHTKKSKKSASDHPRSKKSSDSGDKGSSGTIRSSKRPRPIDQENSNKGGPGGHGKKGKREFGKDPGNNKKMVNNKWTNNGELKSSNSKMRKPKKVAKK